MQGCVYELAYGPGCCARQVSSGYVAMVYFGSLLLPLDNKRCERETHPLKTWLARFRSVQKNGWLGLGA